MVVSLGQGIIEIGEYSEISMYSRVASVGYVKIGRCVLFGPNVLLLTTIMNTETRHVL